MTCKLLCKKISSLILSPKVRNAAFVLGDQAVYSGSSFLTGVIVGRALSIEAFGEFSLGISLMIFSLILQDTLLATPYTYHIHNTPSENRGGLRAGAIIQSLLLAGVSALLLTAAALFAASSPENGGLHTVLLALGCALPFLFVRECFRRQFFAEFNIINALIMDIFVSALMFALLAGFWWTGTLSPALAFGAMALAAGIGGAATLFTRRTDYNFKMMNVLKETKDNILYGRWLLMGSACHLGSLYAYPWLVYFASGKAEAGAFAACYSLVNLLNPLILGFNNYFRPKIMETRIKEGVEAMDRMVQQACLLLLPVAALFILAMFIGGGLLVRIVYGESFTGLGTVIALVSISVLPVFLGAPLQLGTLALNRPQINPKFHAVSLAVTILIGTPLTFTFGKAGAAAGYALAASCGSAMLFWLYRREIRKNQEI